MGTTKWSCFPAPTIISAEDALSRYSDDELLARIDNHGHRYAWAAILLVELAKENTTVDLGIPELIDEAERRFGGTERLSDLVAIRAITSNVKES